MRYLTVLTLAATSLVAAGCAAGGAASVSKEEIRALNDEESMVLLECQGHKVYEKLGREDAEKYLKQEVDKVVKAALAEGPNVDKDPLLQYELAKDGYYCDAQEREQFVKDARQAEQEALWGPPRELQNVDPSFLGNAFADEVRYEVEKEREAFWMGIAEYKAMSVKTNADSDAELLNLAEIIKEREPEKFDYIEVGYTIEQKVSKSANPGTYTGSFVILNSKDGVLLFKDQYPMGPAAKQAEEDYENDDGIVFLGSGE